MGSLKVPLLLGGAISACLVPFEMWEFVPFAYRSFLFVY